MPPPKQDSDEESDSQDEEFVDRLEEMKLKMANPRGSVAAEAMTTREDYKPPVNDKDDATKTHLTQTLDKSFIFREMHPKIKEQVVMAFEQHSYSQGDFIIKQGADVSAEEPGLFMLDSGECAAYKNADKNSNDLGPKVYTYTHSGESFGELALLYNAPRAASVKAESDCKVWSINRETFNHCVRGGAQARRKQHGALLKSVEIFKTLDEFELDKITDALELKSYNAGDLVCKKGELGTEFYIVEEGKFAAVIDGADAATYGPASYFGELALLKKGERACDVVAREPSRALALEERSFRKLLGPLDEIMKARAKDAYGSNAQGL